MRVVCVNKTGLEVLQYENVSKIEFTDVASVPVYTLYLTDKTISVNGNDYIVSIM